MLKQFLFFKLRLCNAVNYFMYSGNSVLEIPNPKLIDSSLWISDARKNSNYNYFINNFAQI